MDRLSEWPALPTLERLERFDSDIEAACDLYRVYAAVFPLMMGRPPVLGEPIAYNYARRRATPNR